MEKSNEVHSLRKSKDLTGIESLLTDDFEYVGGDGRLHHVTRLLGDMQDGLLKDFILYEPQAVSIDSGTDWLLTLPFSTCVKVMTLAWRRDIRKCLTCG